MVLTDRDRRVIADVASFQVLSGQQLMRLGHFQSKTRTNSTLARLVRHGYLTRRYQPSVAGTSRALYCPGLKAVALLDGATTELERVRRRIAALSDLFLAHQLLVTDVRLAFLASYRDYQFLGWQNDTALRPLQLGLIPDGHVEYLYRARQFGAFLEIDRGTEDLARWMRKVQAYLLLTKSDRYRAVFGRPFYRVLVIGESEVRLQNLRTTTAKLTDRIFWFTTLARLLEEGPLPSIWQRPVDAAFHALTES
jgi:hypothetical protein